MKFRIIIFAVVAVLLFGLTACDTAKNVQNVNQGELKQAINYRNGVYYFPYLQEDFGNALSSFLAQHPDMEVAAMTGNGSGSYGSDLGYFVCFRNKKQ